MRKASTRLVSWWGEKFFEVLLIHLPKLKLSDAQLKQLESQWLSMLSITIFAHNLDQLFSQRLYRRVYRELKPTSAAAAAAAAAACAAAGQHAGPTERGRQLSRTLVHHDDDA